MTKKQKVCFLNRINLAIANLRNCNSGSEIHEVSNLRNFANLLLYLVEDETLEEKEINLRLCRLEARIVDFFKRKYRFLSVPKRDKST